MRYGPTLIIRTSLGPGKNARTTESLENEGCLLKYAFMQELRQSVGRMHCSGIGLYEGGGMLPGGSS